MLWNIETIIALLFVVSFHEASHAWVAYKLGDSTAKHAGRLTLNPVAHLSLLGTAMLLLIGLGWGKPVPVNAQNFKNPSRDSAIVSLAGPMSNLLLAFAFAVPLRYLDLSSIPFFYSFFGAIFSWSIILMIFNLIPIPPLDGADALSLVMPAKARRKYFEFLHKHGSVLLLLALADFYLLPAIADFSLIRTGIGYAFTFLSSGILIGT